MFVIIETGGKQYKVAPGRTITVEKIKGSANDNVVLDQVLAFSSDHWVWGSPYVEGAHILARIVEQKRSEKIRIFKRRRRKHSKRSAGHRQNLTLLSIESFIHKGEIVASVSKEPTDQHQLKREDTSLSTECSQDIENDTSTSTS